MLVVAPSMLVLPLIVVPIDFPFALPFVFLFVFSVAPVVFVVASIVSVVARLVSFVYLIRFLQVLHFLLPPLGFLFVHPPLDPLVFVLAFPRPLIEFVFVLSLYPIVVFAVLLFEKISTRPGIEPANPWSTIQRLF
uniref:Uncharacterized protein n=1 Tax=Cacopsylla melanoneura TaxID=428564 RepID=A0A8D8YDP1_9HEMI